GNSERGQRAGDVTSRKAILGAGKAVSKQGVGSDLCRRHVQPRRQLMPETAREGHANRTRAHANLQSHHAKLAAASVGFERLGCLRKISRPDPDLSRFVAPILRRTATGPPHALVRPISVLKGDGHRGPSWGRRALIGTDRAWLACRVLQM